MASELLAKGGIFAGNVLNQGGGAFWDAPQQAVPSDRQAVAVPFDVTQSPVGFATTTPAPIIAQGSPEMTAAQPITAQVRPEQARAVMPVAQPLARSVTRPAPAMPPVYRSNARSLLLRLLAAARARVTRPLRALPPPMTAPVVPPHLIAGRGAGIWSNKTLRCGAAADDGTPRGGIFDGASPIGPVCSYDDPVRADIQQNRALVHVPINRSLAPVGFQSTMPTVYPSGGFGASPDGLGRYYVGR
jgi:hypothetical protein